MIPRRDRAFCREAFALLSSTHPLVPSQLMGELKKSDSKDRPRKRGQVTFQWRAFTNPTRADGLELHHWVKCYKDTATGKVTPAEKEYPFAKYNKPISILRYDDDEWSKIIDTLPKGGEWTREETDYLLDLIESLDMRWLAIADRYDFPDGKKERTVEDLKDRYYSVARELLLLREGGPDAIANNPLVKHPYSADAERHRKAGLELLMKRNPELDAEEDAVLAEAAKIEAKRKAELGGGRRGGVGGAGGAAGAAAVHVLPVAEILVDPPVGTPPLFDAEGKPALPKVAADAEPGTPAPRVVARVAHTREVIETILGQCPPELQKMLQGSMAELKLADLPRAPNRAVCGAYLALLNEVLEHLELKKVYQAKSTGRPVVGMKRVKPEEPDPEPVTEGTAGMAAAAEVSDGVDLPRSEKRQRVARRPFDE